MFKISGLVGVTLGVILSTRLRVKYPRADPLICGTGLILSAGILLGSFFLARLNVLVCFAVIFVGVVALNLNWSIVADILLYVVLPNRRGTAEALQILTSHLLGDAGSPYIIGLIMDALRSHFYQNKPEFCAGLKNPGAIAPTTAMTQCEVYIEFYVMQYSLILTIIVEVLGAMFFFVNAFYIVKDRLRVKHYQETQSEEQLDQAED